MLILAMVATSCSKEKVSSIEGFDPNQIRFDTHTTRSAVIDLSGLKASTVGFVVYAASGSNPTGWFTGIDGTNNYKNTSGQWGWNNGSPLWPTTSTGYPMNFYAYYATSYAGLLLTSPAPSSMTGTYTIQQEANQVDFITAKSSAISKPTSGMLPLTFGHILSKINFGLIPGYGASVYLQSMNVNNVGNQRPYNFISSDWTTQPSTFGSNYSYKNLANPATLLVGVDATEAAVMDVISSNGNLMLMPQIATTWTPTSGVAPANAYMGVIYRIQTTSNVNAIGYAVANSHPDYSTLTSSIQTALNGKPLFVKVGYPFAPTNMTWVKGKGYTYNICLGTANATNGYIADNFYYDEDGLPTPLTIIGKSKGDPISSGKIDFIVNVGDWDNQLPGIII